eukprot:6866604-Pyramimonas_sp.AAC.1
MGELNPLESEKCPRGALVCLQLSDVVPARAGLPPGVTKRAVGLVRATPPYTCPLCPIPFLHIPRAGGPENR